MYITREGAPFYKSIVRNLTDNERGRFLRNLKKEGAKVIGVGFKNITIEDYYARDRAHADEKEIITQEMIKKAYRAIWGGREDYELSDEELYSPYCSWNQAGYIDMADLRRYVHDLQEERSRC